MDAPRLGERTCRRFSFLINFVFWALWIALFLIAGRLLTRLLLPFAAAFLLAAVLQRPLRFLETRHRFRHSFAATALVIAALVLLGAVLAVICWRGSLFFIRLLQTENILSGIRSCGDSVAAAVSSLADRLADVLPAELADATQKAVRAAGDALYSYAAQLLSSLSATMLSFATGALPRFLLGLLFFLLSAVFFTRDYAAVTAFLGRQIPPPQRPLAAATVRVTKETVSGIVRAYVLLGLLTFAELAVGFFLLGIPHAVLLAALTAIVDVLPILGVGTVLLPFAALRLLGGNLTGGLLLLLLYAVVAAVRNLLQPRFVSRSTGLPPLLTLLTMYAGWRSAGLIGLLAAPVFAMVVLRLQQEGHLHIFR